MVRSSSLRFESGLLAEPELLFGSHRRHVDPKAGIAEFGPYSTKGEDSHGLHQIVLGLVGPAEVVGDAEQFMDACMHQIAGVPTLPFQSPSFPGFSSRALRSSVVTGIQWQQLLRQSDLEKALAEKAGPNRIQAVAQLYVDAIAVLAERDRPPDVVACCISDEVYRLCQQSGSPRLRQSQVNEDQLALFSSEDFAAEATSDDLRAAIKAGAMQLPMPTQLLLQRSLQLENPAADVQHLSTRAWNFAVGLLHKANVVPWRSATLSPNTCFVGVSFYRDQRNPSGRMQTSLAQAFTTGGDGYVLRGQSFRWEMRRERDRSPHMDEQSAAALVRSVVRLYERQHNGIRPGRLVIHKSSRYWPDELRGFRSGAGGIGELDLVTLAAEESSFTDRATTHRCGGRMSN